MKINLIYTFLGFFIFQCSLMAQDNGEAKTLLGGNSVIQSKDIGFFVSPSIGFTEMDKSLTSLLNVRVGINFKDRISIGGYFNTSLNEIRPKSETLPNIYMDYWTVGGFAEYTLLAKKLVHLTFPLYVGFGEVQMDNEDGEARLGESHFFQIEPSALLEINLQENIRINLGAGYRFVSDMTYRNFNQADISGLTGYVGLKFGLFR